MLYRTLFERLACDPIDPSRALVGAGRRELERTCTEIAQEARRATPSQEERTRFPTRPG